MNRMMKGGDVCCDYTDGRNCGTFPVSGPQDTAEECADTGAVDTTSLSLRMPLNRKCVPPPRPLARFADSTSTAILVQLPVLGDRAAVPERRPAQGRRHRRGLRALPRPHRGESLLRLPHPCALRHRSALTSSWCFLGVQGTQSGPVSLRIFVEASDNAAPLSAMVSGITSRVNSNHGVQWSPDSWATTQNVQMSADIGGLLAQLTSRPGWEPGNAIGPKPIVNPWRPRQQR